MNKRIKELQQDAFNFVAKQNMTKAEYFWQNIRHNRELQDKVDEKFAELIVKDCARIGELKEQGSAEYDPDTSVGHYMRLHFGVKE
jgi:hypothetical protein